MTRSVGKPPNSQYYELCTCFKEIPTHDSMFRAVCVEPSPISCVSISFMHSTFWSFCFVFLQQLFQLLFVQQYKRGKTVPEFCSYVNIILHTHTLAWWDFCIFLARITPPLNHPYYVFGKNCASPCSVTSLK